MKYDLVVAEIGSTTTVVNAFGKIGDKMDFVGQGQYRTTVEEGDVNIGLKGAIKDLEKNLKTTVEWEHFLASSSAAGGLKMTVHGLVYDMTVKAAKEAALGAGANIKMITAGRLRRTDLAKIKEIKPNIILIAGGVDYGERDTALFNAESIRGLDLDIPIIYAGNIENQEEIKLIFEGAKNDIHIVDNVYPAIDELNIEPTRKVIQRVFEDHIIHAKGMEKIREIVDGNIIPTPGAVMEASILIRESLGDLVTADIGGATTDIHSVCDDSMEYQALIIDPEPTSKRTVEGDLGMYVSRDSVFALFSEKEINKYFSKDVEEAKNLVKALKAIPENEEEIKIVEALAIKALSVALKRHGGNIKEYFTPSGRKYMVKGKDLTGVKNFIGTGGALTRLPGRLEIIKAALESKTDNDLTPNEDVRILIDENYIMASVGVIALSFPDIAKELLGRSFGIDIEKETSDESKS